MDNYAPLVILEMLATLEERFVYTAKSVSFNVVNESFSPVVERPENIIWWVWFAASESRFRERY